MAVNEVFDDNALEMSKKKTTLSMDKYSSSMTSIDENEEHVRISQLPASLNIENESSWEPETRSDGSSGEESFSGAA